MNSLRVRWPNKPIKVAPRLQSPFFRLNERGNIAGTVCSGTSGAHYRLSRRRRAS